MAVTKSKKSPVRKKISAILSSFKLEVLSLRMERNERILLAMNITMARVATSSMIVAALRFNIFMEVSTIKQSPSRLEDVLRMWGDLSLFDDMAILWRADQS